MTATVPLAIEWQIPERWYTAPSGAAACSAWPVSLAAELVPDNNDLAGALDVARRVLSTDPAVLPLVVLGDHEPWVDATGWLSAWPTRANTRAQIEEFFASESTARESLQHAESYEIEAEGGAGRCFMLHSFETAGPDDDALVERIAAFWLDAQAGVTLQLCLVTRNLLAFDDLPALAVEVLARSGPVPGGNA